MPLTFVPAPDRGPLAVSQDELLIRTRVRAEFHDMPGLNLTLTQAARLFGLEPVLCQRVLAALVESGDLATNGTFARPSPERRSARPGGGPPNSLASGRASLR